MADDSKTLPKLMRHNAHTQPTKTAIREKNLGIWEANDWASYYQNVEAFALGLASLGFTRNDKLSVIGDNRPRLYWAQLAAQSLGGVTLPVYQDSIATELIYVLSHAEVSVIVAEDQEQVDKILSLKEDLPTVKLIVYDDDRGMTYYDDPLLKSYDEVQELGRNFAKDNDGYFIAEIDKGKAEDIAMLCYTSGTTGNPKGVMLSHQNLIETGRIFIDVEDIQGSDEWLAYLPMAWVGDAIYSLVLSLLNGAAINCPESPETVQRDLRELGPTGLLAPPRIWENLLSMVQVKAEDATPLKRFVFNHFYRVADKVQLLKNEGKAVPAGLKMQYALGEFLVYGPVRDQFGLRRARWCYTGGAPLGPDTFRFFRAFGINLKQVYGSTEVSGLATYQNDDDANPNTVGMPCTGVDIRISDSNEVEIKSPGVFVGYYKNDEATAATMSEGGWFKTGDAGLFDENGQLVIVDRAKDVGKMRDGTPYAPQFIENKLKFSPYISEAVAFGDDKDYVTAMVAIDFNTVGNWAQRRSLPYTNYMDLSQKPEVKALIQDEIGKANASLPQATRVQRFLLLSKDLDADDAEITRTRKLRRRFIAEKYEPVIRAFYGDADRVELETAVTFEDGSKSVIHQNVTIQNTQQAA